MNRRLTPYPPVPPRPSITKMPQRPYVDDVFETQNKVGAAELFLAGVIGFAAGAILVVFIFGVLL